MVAFGGFPMFNTGHLKSQTDNRGDLIAFCLGLSTNLLIDILSQAGLDFKRDVLTLRRRTHSEGLGFLTKTLPKLGKEIQQALLGNRLDISRFSKLRNEAIPHFLKGLLSRVFNSDGEVREDADICALTDLIQFCMLHYKLEVPYDPEVQDKVLNKFVRTDAQLPENFEHLGSADVRLEPNILRVANSLIKRLVSQFDPKDIVPRHGPGAVATGEKPHEKMHFKRIFDMAEEYYPAHEYYFMNERHLFDDWDEAYWSLDHVAEPVAKVALVPKDSRGPRLISAEPLELQFLQQGLGRKLVAWIERHPLTRGHVNFTDQGVNRDLALEGSIDGKWATLDLSDASDRVSLALVERLFAGTGLLPYLRALRSASTVLPDGRVVRMRKYAPMGSALCFPVEALCFWALAAACIHVVGDVALGKATKSVYVYGDDIIVAGGFEQHLLDNFHYFALRLNKKKCCYSGLFRESCGCDAYRGHIVTPIKVKRLPFSKEEVSVHRRAMQSRNVRSKGKRSRSTVAQIDGAKFASWVAISNLLFQKGYYRAADYVKKHVEGAIGEKLPMSMRDPQRKILNPWEAFIDSPSRRLSDEMPIISDSAPCWYVRQVPSIEDQTTYNNVQSWQVRYCQRFQRYEFRTWVVRPVTYISRKGTSDWRELYRHFLAGLWTKPYRYARLRRVKLQRRWTSIAY